MVGSGHNHFHERSQAERSGYWVHYVVTGGGGAPLHYSVVPPPPQGEYPERKVRTESWDKYFNFGVVAVTSGACTVTIWDIDDLTTYRNQHVVTPY